MSLRLDGCLKCGACVASCPVVGLATAWKFPGPRYLAVEAPRFGRPPKTYESSLECTTCGLCQQACPTKQPLPRAIQELRLNLKVENEGRRRMIENIDRFGRAVAPHSKSVVPDRKKGSVYFPGCIGKERAPEAISSAVGILKESGIEVGISPKWVCCGSPLEKLGEMERAESLRRRNMELLEGAEVIVASCPGCVQQLSQKYGLQVLHFIEYLYEEVDLTKLDFRIGRMRVALHQPCHLVRGIGPHTIDYAHSILSAIPGVEVVDLDAPPSCCGGGGGVAASHPKLARSMAELRVRDAEAAGAELMVAPCPFCVVNLTKVGTLPVEDLSTFIRMRSK